MLNHVVMINSKFCTDYNGRTATVVEVLTHASVETLLTTTGQVVLPGNRFPEPIFDLGPSFVTRLPPPQKAIVKRLWLRRELIDLSGHDELKSEINLIQKELSSRAS